MVKLNREIWHIAGPSIVTNITVPLLGIVDVAIVGHLDNAAAIGAIAVGGLIFNMVYWLFNFLRMGSSGLTAQAYGRRDVTSIRKVLRMGLTVAVTAGVAIFALQRPMEWVAHQIIAPTDEVWGLAIRYFRVRIWAAPAVLSLFAMNGWLVGMQNSRSPLYIAIGQNLTNIAVSYCLVYHVGMGVEGVALGTVVAQYVGLLAAAFLCRRELGLSTQLSTIGVDNPATEDNQQANVDNSDRHELSYQQFFTVNRDIMLRMVCMITVTASFISFGARMGDTVLAVNTLLIQLFTLFSYFLDGFGLAGEALVGKYVGRVHKATDAPQRETAVGRLDEVIRRLFGWGLGVVVLFTLLYMVGGKGILGLLTDDQAIVEAALAYLPWAVAIPACGVAAFMWDGIYIGATATRPMFWSLFCGMVTFFVMRWLLLHWVSDPNNALWMAFLAFLLMRGAVLTWRWKATRSASLADR